MSQAVDQSRHKQQPDETQGQAKRSVDPAHEDSQQGQQLQGSFRQHSMPTARDALEAARLAASASRAPNTLLRSLLHPSSVLPEGTEAASCCFDSKHALHVKRWLGGGCFNRKHAVYGKHWLGRGCSYHGSSQAHEFGVRLACNGQEVSGKLGQAVPQGDLQARGQPPEGGCQAPRALKLHLALSQELWEPAHWPCSV